MEGIGSTAWGLAAGVNWGQVGRVW